ncbi:MAG TPA: twin-arginine translocase subunit TatC [Candidatus Latescibacteria bacterium]|nr:twin-arginine translocase subunit TatC [Candidatus Latescibacterota bacterium]
MKDDAPLLSFWDHLEELRWRIVKSILALLIGGIVSLFFSDRILALLLLPLDKLQGTVRLVNLSPLSMVMVRLYIAIIAGLLVGLPVIVYQAWSFVAPGLYPHERRAVPWVLISTFLLFVIGASLSYTIMPFLFRVLVEAGYQGIENFWNIREYMGFLLGFMGAFGVVFEMPVAVYILSVVGIATPAGLRRSRKYAIVLIFVVSAVLTPSPDPFSQIAMAVPLVALFEVSIGVSALVHRRKKRRREAAESENAQ